MWVMNDLTSQEVFSNSNAFCETLIVKIKRLETLVIVNYRPFDCTYELFYEALNICQGAINKIMKYDTKIRNMLDFGDYNFPCISWTTRSVYEHEREERNNSPEKKQDELYLKF